MSHKTDHVILLAEKSSGSSIFQTEISRHSAIRTVSWTPHTEAETLYWVKAASILGYPAGAFWGGRPPFPASHCRRSIERILQANLGQLPQGASEWAFLKSGWEELIDRFAPVFFEKSPHHLNQWPALACLRRFVRESSRRVRFIGLVRNPLSLIYSAQQRWHSQLYARQFMWEQSYRNLLAMQELLGPEQLLILRYEDVVAQPRETFTRALGFVGLEYEPPIGEGLHANSLHKWRDDERFSFRIHPAVMQLAARFGYTEEEMSCERASPVKVSSLRMYSRRMVAKWRSQVSFYRNHVLR